MKTNEELSSDQKEAWLLRLFPQTDSELRKEHGLQIQAYKDKLQKEREKNENLLRRLEAAKKNNPSTNTGEMLELAQKVKNLEQEIKTLSNPVFKVKY